MFAKRVLAALGSLALVSVGLVALGPSAQAIAGTTWDINVDCTGPIYLPGAPGDLYNFHLVGDCLNDDMEIWNIFHDPDAVFPDPGDSTMGFLGLPADHSFDAFADCSILCDGVPTDWVASNVGGSADIWAAQLLGVNVDGATLANGNVVATVVDFTKMSQWYVYWAIVPSASPPPMWHQAYGRASVDSTCERGWSPSWAVWPNSGTGGWVCTRSIPSLG